MVICDLKSFFFSLKCLVLCFRLHFAKDATIGNTAGATVRQLVSLVFERVVIEDASSNEEPASVTDESFSGASKEFTKLPDSPLKTLNPVAQDAFALFQVNRNMLNSVYCFCHVFYYFFSGPGDACKR